MTQTSANKYRTSGTRALRWLLVSMMFFAGVAGAAEAGRGVIAKAIVLEDAEAQAKAVESLAGNTEPVTRDLLTAWKEGTIYIYTAPDGAKSAVFLGSDADAEGNVGVTSVEMGEVLKGVRVARTVLDSADTDSGVRLAMKKVLDVFALSASDPAERLRMISEVGLAQDETELDALQARFKVETVGDVQRGLREAIALIELKSEDAGVRAAAAGRLGAMGSIPSRDALTALSADAVPEVAAAAVGALAAIERHLNWVNFYGTLFRGLSLGSILLVVAIGLAITFGLMGVINMAHGELIAVGAYTAYLVQNLFSTGIELSPFGMKISIPGFGYTGSNLDTYFIFALPLSFLTAAAVGILLERTVIRFLYRRPLESLLATWGVSLVLQQLFRLTFGSNNVQVYSPSWLSGNWTVFDVILGWNRLFVIAFAVAIIAGTWGLLTKTPLGLLIRAVMQNRQMAACMGVRTERVNMMTFGFGSGLAGLAGAFISQIGNVGPGMGQERIVDSFMTVVVGGVGSIAGTVIAALGIGVLDQSLQQILLNPVLGKILVLGGIILFLQWRPAGLFVTKSRSLEG